MPTFKSLEAVVAEMGKVAKDMEAGEKRRITREQAEAARKLAAGTAAADIGGSFSGWRRGNPIELDTQIKTTRNNGAVLFPTKTSAGPWTVAEKGRNQGNAGGFAGPGIGRNGLTARTKSGGLRKVRARKAKRWNGRTDPKHTASEAVAAMERELPKIAEDGYRRVLRKHFDVT